jgi:colanic acid biosynthesis glycosyl transferase WcaI
VGASSEYSVICMANILILTLIFPPDSVSTAQIMGELSADLKDRGHKLTILTTSPHFNRDEEAEGRQPLHRHWGSILRKSEYYGIPVYHTLMPRKGKSVFLRLLAWLGFHVISTMAGITSIPKPDIIICPSPPLTIGLSAWFLGAFYHAPFIYNVQEIYPDIAVSLGALKNKRLIELLYRLERFVYQKTAFITVIAPRMRQRLLEKGVRADKVKVIPNFVDISDHRPRPKDNEFSRKYGVHDKFLVSYAGNIGPAQGLDKFIDAAILLQKETAIHFMVMGDGSLRESFTHRVLNLNMGNFTVLPYQPYSLIPLVYAASDICLVPLSSGIGSEAIPSKVYRIMACARPVLATTDKDSDLAHLISSVNCGVAIETGAPEALADAIFKGYKNKVLWQAMGKNGRDHVVENYSRSVVTKRYHNLIQTIVG